MKLFGTPGHASHKKDKEQEPGYTPQFALPGSNELISLKEEPWSQILIRWVQALFLYILLLGVIIVALYSGLAATLLIVSPTGDPTGKSDLVVRNLWQETGGKPPVGETAVISTNTPAPTDIVGKVVLGWTGISNPATVEVASDHMDQLVLRGAEVKVGEEWAPLASSPTYTTNPDNTAESSYQLDEQFLVKCVEGENCPPGTYMIIDRGYIYGEQRDL